MTNFGIKQAIQNQSILNLSGPEQLVFSTKYTGFKLYGIEEQEILVPAGITEFITLDFPFDYPVIWAFLKESGRDASKYFAINQWTNSWDIPAFQMAQWGAPTDPASRINLYFDNNRAVDTNVSLALALFTDEILGAERILTPRNNFGVKIGKETRNVFSNNQNDLIYNSEYGTLSIFDNARVTIPKGEWYAIEHNLDYVPVFAAFSASGQALPFTTLTGGGDYQVAADNRYLYLYFDNSFDPVTEDDFYYYIFTERLADQ